MFIPTVIPVISLSLLNLVVSLEVAPSSECAQRCMNDPNADFTDPIASSTQPADVVCNDWELGGANSSNRGRKWKDCVTCESTSAAHGETTADETDTYWFLCEFSETGMLIDCTLKVNTDLFDADNIKATLILCLWQFPQAPLISSSADTCATVCGAKGNRMKAAMMEKSTQINNTLQYNYCTAKNGIFTQNQQACSNCLEKVPSSQTLRNYIRALNDACQQRPQTGTGKQIKLDFPLFPNDTSKVQSSRSDSNPSTSSTATSSLETGMAATSPAEPNATFNAVQSNDSSATKIGLRVGLGLGVPLLAALAALALLLWKRTVDRRTAEAEAARRIEWEYQFRAKVFAEIQELHGFTRLPPELKPTPIVEADAGPPVVPEKDSEVVLSPDRSSTFQTPISPNDHSTSSSSSPLSPQSARFTIDA